MKFSHFAIAQVFSLLVILQALPVFAQTSAAPIEATTNQVQSHPVSLEHPPMETDGLAMIFADIQTPDTIIYPVVYGDTLGKIARRYQTTVEVLKKSNHLTSNRIYEGQKLRVWVTPLTIEIDKSDNILVVKAKDQVIKTYRVATGANNITPVGEFTIGSRIKNPTWFKKGEIIPPDSPENALGSRWLGFDKPQYGIHGTIHPELIGQQVSHGCVRMLNKDVEELFTYIQLGTKVIITD